MRGLSTSPSSRFFQIGGILASLLSVAKFCSEWHLFTAFNFFSDTNRQVPPRMVPTLKAMLFFVPHVLFRTTSTAVICAFLRLYAAIPLFIFLVTSFVIFIFHWKIHNRTLRGTIIDMVFSFFAPVVHEPFKKFGPPLLKATMLTSTAVILPCLLFIRLLPYLLSPSALLCTWGFSHINLQISDSPSYNSSCFNTNVTSGTPRCIHAFQPSTQVKPFTLVSD